MNHHTRQSGSALIIILIAIAMFAALSYAVFQGGSISGAQMTQDQARLAAQEIFAYGDAMAKTVQTLKLRDCTDTQLDFANSVWVNDNGTYVHNTGHNPSAPATGCGVFKTEEGNLQATLFPENYFDNTASGTTKVGSSRIRVVRLVNLGVATEADLYMMIPKLKKEICLALNSIVSVDSVSGNPPDVVDPGSDYTGSYASTNAATDTDGKVAGKSAYCSGESSNYTYNRVLIVR